MSVRFEEESVTVDCEDYEVTVATRYEVIVESEVPARGGGVLRHCEATGDDPLPLDAATVKARMFNDMVASGTYNGPIVRAHLRKLTGPATGYILSCLDRAEEDELAKLKRESAVMHADLTHSIGQEKADALLNGAEPESVFRDPHLRKLSREINVMHSRRESLTEQITNLNNEYLGIAAGPRLVTA